VTAGEQPVQTPQFVHHAPSNRSVQHSNRIVDRYLQHSRSKFVPAKVRMFIELLIEHFERMDYQQK